ncbi:hypothetical protein LEMLEM_LOCUS27025 [Lemmus lemmus]
MVSRGPRSRSFPVSPSRRQLMSQEDSRRHTKMTQGARMTLRNGSTYRRK